MNAQSDDHLFMELALKLAAHGQGSVEPNPMVGCVVVQENQVVGEGWHQRFGSAHAEVEALRVAADRARGATVYVTLEPCCHHGKTPPCTSALLNAGVARVVVAMRDPFPQVDGGGLKELQEAGVDVHTGVCEEQARQLNAPYLRLISDKRPWIIAKWAMTLDGKIACRTGESQWITNETSRAWVHRLRARVDGILVGRGTVEADDPLLTARPDGDPEPSRMTTRVVLDSTASIAHQTQLVQTAGAMPLLVAVATPSAVTDRIASAEFSDRVRQLRDFGVDVLECEGNDFASRWRFVLQEMGRRKWTNLLVEGGSAVLGTAADTDSIDEVHVFIAPKVIAGNDALTPVGGIGVKAMQDASRFSPLQVEDSDGDLHIFARRASALST